MLSDFAPDFPHLSFFFVEYSLLCLLLLRLITPTGKASKLLNGLECADRDGGCYYAFKVLAPNQRVGVHRYG